MFLRLLTEYVHLVLVQTLIRAELELLLAVLEVHVVHRVAHVFAPVADFVFLEGGAATLGEAELAAEHLACARVRLQGEEFEPWFLTPCTDDVARRYCGR